MHSMCSALTRMSHPKCYIEERDNTIGDDVIVAVSDMHLGYCYCNEPSFREFFDEIVCNKEVEHLVLVGDTFEMWRRDPLKLLISNIDMMNQLKVMHNEKREVHFLVGNHDYHLIELNNEIRECFGFNVSEDVTLSSGGHKYYFIHGHQFEHPDDLERYHAFCDIICMTDDETGSCVDSLWELYKTVSPLVQRIRDQFTQDLKKMLSPPEERLTEGDIDRIKEGATQKLQEEFGEPCNGEYLVYGHTHEPMVDEDRNVANAGSWIDEPNLPDRRKYTYITIEEGRLELREYP